MYEFTDTLAGSGNGVALLSLNTVFNNYNLDEQLTDGNGGFTTISVNGRGILSRRISTNEIVGINGARERDYTYDIREITVRYRLRDNTNEGFRERFNSLNELLMGSEIKLSFTDEDAYFIATLQSGDMPDEDSNDLIGSLSFLCTDPLKRKAQHTINVSSEQMHEINGQISTPWTSKTTFAESASQYTLTSSAGNIELNYEFISGDVLIIDYEGRGITLNGVNVDVGLSLRSVWFDLDVGYMTLESSHETELTYTERFN